MKFFNNIWFTLAELIVSISISSILLWGIFYFISQNIEEITLSNNKTDFYTDLNYFREKSLSISNTYSSGVVFVDNVSWSWSDILLLTSKIKDDWYLIWVVDKSTMKLESGSISYNTYYDKVLWYTRISSSQISDIYTNSWNIYNVSFFKDHIYDNLKVKDFQVDLYNSWSIINIDSSFFLNYNSGFSNQLFSTLAWIEIFKINLNF